MFAVRSNGAALAGLFGPKQKPRPAKSYATLAEALSDSDELKSLAEIMAHALGIEVTPHDEAEIDADQHEARPYRLSPDAVLSISPDVMEYTKALLQAHGWQSRAWQ